jgi:uncharacterized protein (DUF952 family)
MKGFESGWVTVKMILHIAQRERWEGARLDGFYRGDTLDSQGFIRCSAPEQIVKVANALFHGREDLILLCIDVDRVESEIRYEGTGEEKYPHIYGPLNVDAVVKALDFRPRQDGKFTLPRAIFSMEDRR